MDRDQLIAAVKNAGVVGAGGAGFPTHQKLAASVDTVVINGAECEPLLHVDQELMADKAAVLVKTLQALMLATGAARGIIALKQKYHRALAALQKAVPGAPVEICQLPNFYPVGDEQVLTFEATGRVVPSGGIPPQVGVLVSNVETVINIAASLAGEPVTTKYLTVTGEVARPGTYLAPVGMGIADLLQVARPKRSDLAIISGGPMMGSEVSGGDPVTKTTKGLILLPPEHALVRKKQLQTGSWNRLLGGCCQCRLCTDFCPRYLLGQRLEPHRSMRSLAMSSMELDWLTASKLCCECGLCNLFVCPAGLSPLAVHQAVKKQLAAIGYRGKAPSELVPPRTNRSWHQVPVERLVHRLGLTAYLGEIPFYRERVAAARVVLPLRQSIGSPAQPVVAVGSQVERGQLIARCPDGALGANLHASISGVVTAVNDGVIIEAASQGGTKWKAQ